MGIHGLGPVRGAEYPDESSQIKQDVQQYGQELSTLETLLYGYPNQSDPLQKIGIFGVLQDLAKGKLPSNETPHEVSAWVVSNLLGIERDIVGVPSAGAGPTPAWMKLQDGMYQYGWTPQEIFPGAPRLQQEFIIKSPNIDQSPPFINELNQLIGKLSLVGEMPDCGDENSVSQFVTNPNWSITADMAAECVNEFQSSGSLQSELQEALNWFQSSS